jgi:hypothetical protein
MPMTQPAPMPDFDLPLPTIVVDATYDWQWPRPPIACEVPDVRPDASEPCRVDTTTGVSVTGDLVHFDADSAQMRFRMSRGGEPVLLPFSRVRRLTLTTPWRVARPLPGAPVERVPPQAQLRSFVANLSGGGSLFGVTRGHVDHPAGTFLFVPGDEDGTLMRQFIPRSACSGIEFGASTEEQAARHWISTREALVAALAEQGRQRIVPLGEALLELGLVGRDALDQALRDTRVPAGMPMGERLVYLGLIDRGDLNAALAHKMGYPMVNLTLLPVDRRCASVLGVAAMLEHRALPVLLEPDRLVVAVDELASLSALKALESLAGRPVVPVLASRGQLSIALAQASQGTDVWAHNVPTRF